MRISALTRRDARAYNAHSVHWPVTRRGARAHATLLPYALTIIIIFFMALRLSIVYISRKTIRRIFLILFLLLSLLYLFFFYLKNILIASSSSSGIIIGLDDRSEDGDNVNIIGRGFDDCIEDRGVGGDKED